MEIGDSIRIKNDSGCMDVRIKEILDGRGVKVKGIRFPNESNVRVEYHEGKYGVTLISLYADIKDNRDIYLVEPSYQDVAYYLGYIEKTESENTPLFTTV